MVKFCIFLQVKGLIQAGSKDESEAEEEESGNVSSSSSSSGKKRKHLQVALTKRTSSYS
jgi:hypothetical protein